MEFAKELEKWFRKPVKCKKCGKFQNRLKCTLYSSIYFNGYAGYTPDKWFCEKCQQLKNKI